MTGSGIFYVIRRQCRVFAFIVVIIIIFAAFGACGKKNTPIGPSPGGTATITQLVTPTTTATIAAYNWIVIEPNPPVSDVSNICADTYGNTIYVGYLTGSGLGRQMNMKYYTTAGGWRDGGAGIGTTFNTGTRWFCKGAFMEFAVACDFIGYVYVYYRWGGPGWNMLGTGPIAGPFCREASVAAQFGDDSSDFGDNILVMYVDGLDNNKLKLKWNQKRAAGFKGWQDAAPGAGTYRVSQYGDGGLSSIRQYYCANNHLWCFSLVYSDAASGGISAFSLSDYVPYMYFMPEPHIDTSGLPSYISMAWPYVAYSDAGRGNRAVFRRYYNGIWDEIGGGPASPGPAKNISIATSGLERIAFTDDTAGGRLTVMESDAWNPVYTWTDLDFPEDYASSCAMLHNELYKPCVVYSTDTGSGRRLRLGVMQ